MNRKTVSMLVIAAAAGSAFGQAPPPSVVDDFFVSTMTRQQVDAELVAFKKSGMNPWSGLYDPLKYFESRATRGEVETGYIAARKEVAALTGEDSGSAWLDGAGQPAPAQTLAGTR